MNSKSSEPPKYLKDTKDTKDDKKSRENAKIIVDEYQKSFGFLIRMGLLPSATVNSY